MKLKFDKIIIGCNDDPDWYNFWELSYRGWKAFFPDLDIILTFVTNRSESDDIVKYLKQWGTVKLYPEVPDIPTPNLAKASRLIEATKHGNDICMVNDIDLVPLQSEYVYNRLNLREDGKLLGIGIFQGYLAGKFPMGYTTGESNIWKQIVNPNDLSYIELVNSWKDLQVIDRQEAINNPPSGAENIWGFSDESLLRALRSKTTDLTKIVDRGFEPWVESVDRACWERLDLDKLNNGYYVEAHLVRPIRQYMKELRPIIEYIKRKENDLQV